MAGPGICVLCLADTCTSEVHPVFNPVAPYGYLLSDTGYKTDHRAVLAFTDQCTSGGTGPYRSALVRIY